LSDKTEDVEVSGLGGSPAPEKDINSDSQIDEPDDPGEVLEGSIGRDGKDGDGIELDAVTDDAVLRLAIDVRVLEFAVEVGAHFDGAVIDGGEQISGHDAGLGSRTALSDANCHQAGENFAGRFGPDNAIVWLLITTFLLKIKNRKKKQGYRCDSQQRCYNPVIEVRLHGGSLAVLPSPFAKWPFRRWLRYQSAWESTSRRSRKKCLEQIILARWMPCSMETCTVLRSSPSR
jgi:hypothetical protein